MGRTRARMLGQAIMRSLAISGAENWLQREAGRPIRGRRKTPGSSPARSRERNSLGTAWPQYSTGSLAMQDQRAYVAGLRQAISDVRLDAYRRPGDADDLDAVARYLWNIALSEALYPTLQALEITLRNSLHLAISKHFRNAMWFDRQPSLLHQLELDKVAAAKRELQQEHKPLEAGR